MGQRNGGRWQMAAAALVLVSSVGAVASCGGDDSPAGGSERSDRDEQSETTAAPDGATSTTLSPTQEVEQAFIAFNLMVERLAQAPNPDDPEIAQRASGETLAGIVDSQTTLQTTGVRAEYGERQATEVLGVTIVDESTALVSECTIEDLLEVGPSETRGPFVTTFWTEWTVRRVDDAWFVDSFERIGEQAGEHPCE